MDLRLGTQGIFGKRGSQLLGYDINPTPMVLRQIIVPGGVQVQDTSCARPEDQDGGENNKGSIKKTKWKILMEFSIKRRTPPPS